MHERAPDYTDITQFLPQDPETPSREVVHEDTPAAEEDEKIDETRRTLLEVATALTVTTIPGAYLIPSEEEDTPAPPQPPAPEPARAAEVTEAQETPEGSTLTEQLESGSVNLNKLTIEAITRKWVERYAEGGARHQDLLHALERMGPWRAHIEQIFIEEGVPRELALLAIPESHFTVDAASPAGARGAYQFMKQTAKKKPASLILNNEVDERNDPLESARACARLLKDNFRRMNDDWDLALSGYNGGYPWRYANERLKRERSYGDFLRFMEKRINTALAKTQKTKHGKEGRTVAERFYDVRQNINYAPKLRAVVEVVYDSPELYTIAPGVEFQEHTTGKTEHTSIQHTIVKGDTVFGLARRYNTEARTIAAANGNKEDDLIQIGKVLTIPLTEKPNESLEDVARNKDVPLKELMALNPAVIAEHAPLPDHYVIRIPTTQDPLVIATQEKADRQ